MLSMISALPGTWYRIINQNATYTKGGAIYGDGGVKGIFEALYSDDIEWEDLEDAGLIGSDIQALAPEDLATYIYNDTSLYRKL